MTTGNTCRYCDKTFSARMLFCPFCGGENPREPTTADLRCPRCRTLLDEGVFHNEDIHICPSCGGLWLDRKDFRKLTSERTVFNDDSIPFGYVHPPHRKQTGYLPCPACGDIMNRTNFRAVSGVFIDSCRHHGVWLDEGELEQVRRFIANGGLERSLERQIFDNREAVTSLQTRMRTAEFMEKVMHPRNLKRWIFRNC